MDRSQSGDSAQWTELLLSLPQPHLLQTWQWGELKGKYGWQAERHYWHEAGVCRAAAQILFRTHTLPGIGIPLTIAYCPRGPVLDWSDSALRHRVLADLPLLAQTRSAIFLKIDPGVSVGTGEPGSPEAAEDPLGRSVCQDLAAAGWRASAEQIQFRNTYTLDLRAAENDLLAGMKQKTRYNIGLAQRKGVQIRQGGIQDLDLLYRMYAETCLRDGFAIRKPEYYRDAWGAFIEAGSAQALIAAIADEPVAALLVYRFGPTAWYLYGMSRTVHREAMPTHLLQWEAIRWARARGCSLYDFWGAPDRLDSGDPMWGVHRFKAGFGARLVWTIGAWDLPLRPALCALYSGVLPKVMAVWRARGHRQTRQSIDS